MWTIGYTGQSPERLKMHMANQATFDRTTLQAVGGPADGDYYGLPWPCWGTAEMGHPGTPNLYDTSKPVAEGGLNFRARFGVERNGDNLLAEGSYPVGNELQDGHPEFNMAMLKQLGWDGDLTDEERSAIEAVAGDKTNWKTDLSGGIQRVAIKHGCAPFGNAKARAVVWNFPDPVPLHREPLYTSRQRPRRRLSDLQADTQELSSADLVRVASRRMTTRRTSRSFSRRAVWSNTKAAAMRRGPIRGLPNSSRTCSSRCIRSTRTMLGLATATWSGSTRPIAKVKVMAMVTERVGRGVAFMPFHFAGHFQGEDLRSKYPEGADPYVLGEAANTAMTYGYDSVTQMQESKCSLCRIEAA